MEPMTQKMVNRRMGILVHIYNGKSDRCISNLTGHSRKLIAKVRSESKEGAVKTTYEGTGRPTKSTDEVRRMVESISTANPRMGSGTFAQIMSEPPSPTTYSHEFVRKIRHDLGYDFLPPITRFPLTEAQITNRLSFANHHLSVETNWGNVIFVDESSFELGANSRWVWRKRCDTNPLIYNDTVKFPQKVMVFGGISKNWKTPLIALEGTVDSCTYIDECIDGTGLIPEMNRVYGHKKWSLVQDGATAHTAQVTRDYLSDYCNVIPNWPSGSPDLNPIENLWGIMKKDVEDYQPKTKDDLIETIFRTWESITQETINNLINSMTTRLREVVTENGRQTSY